MISEKTAAGHQVLKDRSMNLTPRQRTALILIDGKRRIAEVLQSGATPDDIEKLFDLELITPARAATPAAAVAPPQAAAGSAATAMRPPTPSPRA